MKFEVNPEFEVLISINGRAKKPHKFDWGNDKLLVECKRYTWTSGGNSPSAKFATANEAMLYFIAAPQSCSKMLFMSETERLGKRNPRTLAQSYVERYGHFIPNDVEVYEFSERTLGVRRVWPLEAPVHQDNVK